METNAVLGRNELFSAMQDGTPYKSYIKAILGKVRVTTWDNFTNEPIEVILQGNPKKHDDTSIVDVWSEREDMFFKRMNVKVLKAGIIIPYERKPKSAPVEKTVEQSTDEELKTIINAKFLKLQSELNHIESVVVLYRMLGLAEEMDKSEKITGAIQARISEVQSKNDTPKAPVTEEE